MVIEADYYKVRLQFERLFADPILFEDPANTVGRYLQHAKPSIKTSEIYQTTDQITPLDKAGKNPGVSGTARYVHCGRVVRSEYLENVSIEIEYADLGSGLAPEEHERLWKKQKWGRMNFVLDDLHRDHVRMDIPSIQELYEMVSIRADPTTLVDVELPALSDNFFHLAVRYLENRLKQLAKEHGHSVEIYIGRDLLPEERQALEKRLTRPSTMATIYILLSKGQSAAAL